MIFATPELTPKEESVIDEVDTNSGHLRHMLHEPRRWYGTLRRTTVARNIQGSNSIEGYNVSLEDAVAAVQGEAPLDATEDDWNAVRSYSDSDDVRPTLPTRSDSSFAHSAALIRSLHFMMMKDDLTAMPGRYRPGAVSLEHLPEEVVYEGPDFEVVP